MRSTDASARRRALERAAQIDPTNARALRLLGFQCLRDGDAASAREAFAAAIEIAPHDAGARAGLVRAHRLAGDDASAIAVAEAGVRGGGRAEDYQCLVDLARASGRVDLVEAHWSRLRADLLGAGRTSASLECALDAAVLTGRDEEAAGIAEQLRIAAPVGASSARSFAMEVAGAHLAARQAAWWLDNVRGTVRAARATTKAPTPLVPDEELAAPDLPALCAGWERDFEVDRWIVNGVHVWPMIRARLGFLRLATARGQSEVVRVVNPERPGLQRFENAARWVRRLDQQLRVLGPCDVVISGTPSQRLFLDGTWIDRLLDPVAEAAESLGLRTAHLEYRSDRHDYRIPTPRPSLLIRPAIDGLLKSTPAARTWQSELLGYDTLAAREGLGLSALHWAARVHQLLRLSDFFTDLFEVLRPRLVIIVCYFEALGWSMLLAARRLGIPTVDLQHGVTSGHPMYARWTRHPAGGYALLPDTFWAWTRTDADRITSWGGRAVIGGHPWMAYFRGRSPETLPPRGRRTVLVSLNWSSGFDERIRAAIAASPADWIWWVRLHPKMDAERASIRSWADANGAGRAHVDAPTDLPLPALLAAADVHLTLSSTVTQEAARFGLPTVTLDPRASLIYAEEARCGYVRHADGSPDAILGALEAQYERRDTMSTMEPYPDRSAMAEAIAALLEVET